MDSRKEYNKNKIKELQDKMKYSTPNKLASFVKAIEKMTPEQREETATNLKQLYTQLGNMALDRAFTDGTLTEFEWLKIQKQYGLTIESMGDILCYYYENQRMKKEEPTEKLILLTPKDSIIDFNRTFLKERFGIEIITAEALNEELEHEKNTKIKQHND